MSGVETTKKTIEIPFNEILVDDFNCRSSLEDIEKLAEGIKEVGLKTPLDVMRAGDRWKLVSGFRRHAALKLLRTGSKPVTCTVEEPKNDADLHIVNLSENINRKTVKPYDLARRLSEMAEGTYPRVIEVDGETAEQGVGKIAPADIARKLGMSKSHVNNLIRVHNNICDEVKEEWRKRNIDLTTIIEWSKLSPEEQIKALEEWISLQEMESEDGEPKKRKKRKKDDESNAAPSRSLVAERLGELKLEAEEAKGSDAHFLQGAIKALRWVTGDLKRL